MPGEEKEKYLQAVAECLELARATEDEQMRSALVALAQKWLDLANYRGPDNSPFRALVEAFNDWQMNKR